MRTININISLEDYTSRLPGVIPAYEGDSLYFFDTASLETDDYRHKSNYGMCPLDLVLSGISVSTKYDDWALSCITEDFASGYGIVDLSLLDCSGTTTLSWNHISDMFGFFRTYYALLNDYSSCELAYSSATDYYYTEINNLTDETDLLFGTDEDTYTEFDQRFERYGGYVSAITASDIHEDYKEAIGYMHEPIIQSIDTGFFKWLCENVVPAYFVPKEYVDAYNGKLLFYPDAISWYGWLKRMSYKYTGDTIDCMEYALSASGDTNCCECEDYVKHGGIAMRDSLKEWIDKVNETILDNNDKIKNSLSGACIQPQIFQNISLTNSIEDLGELSIFSNEWEEGVNYSEKIVNYPVDYTISATCIGIKTGSTVVIKDDKAYILDKECKGYKYDDRFCEFVWGNDTALTFNGESYDVDASTSWLDYSERYLNASGASFSSDVVTYTYDENKRFVGNPTPSGMAQEILLEDNDGLGYIEHLGELYPIYQNECIMYTLSGNPYLNGRIFIVNREKGTGTPYIEINNKKVYADFNDNAKYSFYFNDMIEFDKFRLNLDASQNFVSINGVTYKVANGQISYTLDVYNQSFSKVDSYFTYGNEEHYVLNDKVVKAIQNITSGNDIINTFEEDLTWQSFDLSALTESALQPDEVFYQIESGTNIISAVSYYESYPINYVTGICMSKIQSVKSENLYYDDLGNPMDGYYAPLSSYAYAQPLDGQKLVPYYNVANATSKKELYYKDGVQYYIGNIIESMTFYYSNLDGTKNENFLFSWNLDNRDDYANSLEIIELLEAKYKENEESESPEPIDDIIYCDIVYCIGATLTISNGRWDVAPNTHKGVQYYETVTFIPEQEQYYLASDTSCNVICYILSQETNIFDSSDYSISVETPSAVFKMQILTFNDELDGDIFKTDNGFENNNGLMIAPVFRQEYMLNVSQPEYVETNIKIDRGINSAFEKHIKLGEVNSFEALEQYGNGYFNMLDA